MLKKSIFRVLRKVAFLVNPLLKSLGHYGISTSFLIFPSLICVREPVLESSEGINSQPSLGYLVASLLAQLRKCEALLSFH